MSSPRHHGSAGHVLLVESDAACRDELVGLLEKAGLSVLPVSEGAAALDAMSSRMPDLVITELYLDGMDGFEFLRAVRKRWPLEPIIVVCSRDHWAGVGVMGMAIRLGVTHLLDKPVDRGELTRAVSDVLAIGRCTE